ncbi:MULTISPECIES: hypothetical protein [Kitasatospora]|uniref:Uncharacterized protein n=2 Tax=Kitasatospora TaxID=2063 RepID=A0ABT1JAE7_9ACTN|nr:hypothetical protein [Kitasatospora paracochleata]MCP2313631.1 hypothetical protein [Kitasatospora paracochleata]
MVVHDETEEEPLFAEAIVEFDSERYPEFVADAMDSGLVLALGDPPATTAVVHVRGHRLTRLVLIGGRQVWEPTSPVELTDRWLEAAVADGEILLTVVPPGTWPAGMLELPPDARDRLFAAALQDAHESGLTLHGTVRLVEESPEGGGPNA